MPVAGGGFAGNLHNGRVSSRFPFHLQPISTNLANRPRRLTIQRRAEISPPTGPRRSDAIGVLEPDIAVRILLTNDDGIFAPGLRAIYEELTRLGSVEVVAPAAEQSGVGLSVTYLHPLLVDEELRDGRHWGWAVAGSPADCVKLGMLEYCKPEPDLVVSGINSGMNAGINVLYSGTVAGAIEGAFYGVPSIAVSASTNRPPDYARAARIAVPLIQQLVERGLDSGDLWNINIPENRPDYPRGVKMTTLSVRRHVDVMERRLDPRGRPYFWSGLDPLENHLMTPGTDVRELADGYVTLTPLDFDITDRASYESLEGWCPELGDVEGRESS